MMRRREFIALIGGVAEWPRAARAQQSSRLLRRIGFLNYGERLFDFFRRSAAYVDKI